MATLSYIAFSDDPERHPAVECRPEPYESLAARASAAFDYCFDADRVDAGGIRPAEVRENVFDFEDGLRLVLSREGVKIPGAKVFGILLHARASIVCGSRLQISLTAQVDTIAKRHPPKRKVIRDLDRMAKRIIGDIEKRIQKLTGRPFAPMSPITPAMFSGDMHFLYQLKSDDPLGAIEADDTDPQEIPCLP